jgi:hypothetical protein
MKRAEHDFIKMLAKLVKELPANNLKCEIVALVDGYFLTMKEQTRATDKEEVNG